MLILEGKRGGRKRIILAPEPERVVYPVTVDREWGKRTAQELVRLLIEARRSKRMPAAHIAEMMGVQPEILYRLERNQRDPTLGTALRYARALGLDFNIVEAA